MTDQPVPQPPDDISIAKHAHFADTVNDLMQASSDDDTQAAISAFQQAAANMGDQQAWLNALHVPRDAGEHADALTRMLLRIPDGWGRSIDCGAGWYEMIVKLDHDIAQLAPNYQINQVKEKFGTLRFYWTFESSEEDSQAVSDRISELVREVEQRSAVTCEQCGAAGELRLTQSAGPWLRTTCDEHAFGRQGDALLTQKQWDLWWIDEEPRFQEHRRRYEIERWPGKRTLLVGEAERELVIEHEHAGDEASARTAAAQDWDGVWLGSGPAAEAFVAALSERHQGLRAQIVDGLAAAKASRTGYAYPRMPGIGELYRMDRDAGPDVEPLRELGRYVSPVSENLLAG
jgi:hypothetical protein